MRPGASSRPGRRMSSLQQIDSFGRLHGNNSLQHAGLRIGFEALLEGHDRPVGPQPREQFSGLQQKGGIAGLAIGRIAASEGLHDEHATGREQRQPVGKSLAPKVMGDDQRIRAARVKGPVRAFQISLHQRKRLCRTGGFGSLSEQRKRRGIPVHSEDPVARGNSQ